MAGKRGYVCPACLAGECAGDPDACQDRRCTCCGDPPAPRPR